MRNSTEAIWIERNLKEDLLRRKRLGQTYNDVIKELLTKTDKSLGKKQKFPGDMFGR